MAIFSAHLSGRPLPESLIANRVVVKHCAACDDLARERLDLLA